MRNNLLYDAPVAPLGLGGIDLPMRYTPIAPLGLFRSGRGAILSHSALLGRVDICEAICNRRGEVASPIEQGELEPPNHTG